MQDFPISKFYQNFLRLAGDAWTDLG